MAIIDTLLAQFVQTNKIVKTGKQLLMSGELDLSNLDGVGVSFSCYIGKGKKILNQDKTGRGEKFESYLMAKHTADVDTDDLIITELGEVFIVGAVSIKNENTTINDNLNEVAYLYAELELYTR